MDLSNLLTAKSSSSRSQATGAQPAPGAFHPSHQQAYSAARLTLDTSIARQLVKMASASPTDLYAGASAGSRNGSISPRQHVLPKHVQFELLFPQSPQYRARLPLRVQIYPHDDTESIISTVKNFYGLYNGVAGISFEDDRKNTLIARYENFSNNMVVHVRVIEESPQPVGPFNSTSFQPTALDYADHLGHHTSRPGSRTSRRRSPSPGGNGGRRSASVSTNPAGKKARSRSAKNHGSNYDDSVNGYSSGDGAAGSVSSRAKDHIGNTDISVENIVEGGRRKRAKFESSVSTWNLYSMQTLNPNCFIIYRNYRCLPLRKCLQPRQTLQCPRPAESTTSGHHYLSPIRDRIPSPIPNPSNLPKATLAIANGAHLQHR